MNKKPWVCSGTDSGEHVWTPVTFSMELGTLPHPEHGRVYCVCVPCHAHTYMITKWVGYCLPEPEEGTP